MVKKIGVQSILKVCGKRKEYLSVWIQDSNIRISDFKEDLGERELRVSNSIINIL